MSEGRHICVVYDCLFPYTIGGAERWYRNLAQRLAEDGHDVTYVTMRQWERGVEPDLPGVRVLAVAPRMPLYDNSRRRVLPPIVFGLGILWHLLRHGRRYEVVHTASFPYFSLLAAGLARPFGRYRLVVDWHEVWTRSYWHEYLGRSGGGVGWLVQRVCLRLPQRAFCFSRLHERRLHELSVNGEVTVLEGQFEGQAADAALPAEPLVVFAGRHISEKRPEAVVAAIARAREVVPGLRGVIFGDGPERPSVIEAISAEKLEKVIEAPGFVDLQVIESSLERALCLVAPSRREGYGLVVLEACARGVPTVLVRGPDNAASELVVPGENGFVADDAGAEALATAIARVHDGGDVLRDSTLAWFRSNARRLALETSLTTVSDAYRGR